MASALNGELAHSCKFLHLAEIVHDSVQRTEVEVIQHIFLIMALATGIQYFGNWGPTKSAFGSSRYLRPLLDTSSY